MFLTIPLSTDWEVLTGRNTPVQLRRMKRRKLEKHLRDHGCELKEHGANHDHWWNPQRTDWTSVPRHAEVGKQVARLICQQLGVPEAKGD